MIVTVSPIEISPPLALPVTSIVAASSSVAFIISSLDTVLIITSPCSADVSTVTEVVVVVVFPASSLDSTV